MISRFAAVVNSNMGGGSMDRSYYMQELYTRMQCHSRLDIDDLALSGELIFESWGLAIAGEDLLGLEPHMEKWQEA
jgi:hypothetical protein